MNYKIFLKRIRLILRIDIFEMRNMLDEFSIGDIVVDIFISVNENVSD